MYNTGHRGRSSTIQTGHVGKGGQIKPTICFSQQTWCKGACILQLCIPHCNRKFLICTVYIYVHARAFEPLSFGRLDVFWKRFHGGHTCASRWWMVQVIVVVSRCPVFDDFFLVKSHMISINMKASRSHVVFVSTIQTISCFNVPPSVSARISRQWRS